tara:strand:+ start:122 stop:511 length:390 start_codon:yes stop_codon:yes gene_type:complete
MGFIGGYILPNIGITELDRKDAYYIIDDINFLADKTTENDFEVKISISVYPSIEDRNARVNLLETDEYTTRTTRDDITNTDNLLETFYVIIKPMIITRIKPILNIKLDRDTHDEIPSEYSEYCTLTDHI